RNRYRLEALWTGEPRRRCTHAPYRIGQDPQAIDLQQQRRVSEPGDTQPTGRGAQPGLEWIDRRQRLLWNAALAAADELTQRRQRCIRIPQAGKDRVPVAKLLAAPQRRGFDELEPRALGIFAERFHCKA